MVVHIFNSGQDIILLAVLFYAVYLFLLAAEKKLIESIWLEYLVSSIDLMQGDKNRLNEWKIFE